MTYYKFAERNVDSQINWAEVGKNMTNMLANEVKIREEKKAALDQASRDYAQKLTDAPMGDNELLNNFTLDVADSAKQSLLMFDNLLKSGQLNPNDYLKSVQNLNTGTENLFNLSKEYNAQYAETMKRMQDGDSQLLEQDTFASLEGYAMLGNHKAYINPTDGTISLGEMIPGPNGVMQMGKPVSVSDLRNRITQKYDKYDVEKRVGEVIGSIQAQTKLIEIQNKYGISIVEEDDFFKKEKGKYVYAEAGQFLENTIKGIKAIDTNVTSILTENVVLGVNGEQFMYVQKQGDDWVDVRTGEVVKEKKENHIETSINPRSGKREFNFTEKQEEQVDNYLKEQILARAKSEQRFKRAIQPPVLSASQEAARAKADTDLQNAIAWRNLRSGQTPEEKESAANALLSTEYARKNGLVKIDAVSEPGKLILEYEDTSKNRTLDLSKGTPIEWQRQGNEVFGDIPSSILNKSVAGQDFIYTQDIEPTIAAERKGKKTADIYMDEYNKYLNQNLVITDEDFKDEEDLATSLRILLKSKFGLDVTSPIDPLSEKIKIKNPTTGKSETFFVGEGKDKEEVRRQIISWVKDNTDLGTIIRESEQGRLKISPLVETPAEEAPPVVEEESVEENFFG